MFPGLLDVGALGILRGACDAFVAREDARMAAAGTEQLGLSHKGRRYFANECQREMPALRPVAFGEALAEICRATLGGDAYFFFDQFVVKGPDAGLAFAWHQDSAYAAAAGVPDHAPYLTCWCPLDDAGPDNGTIVLIPDAHDRPLAAHRATGTADLAADVDATRAVRIDAKAGDVVAFSSRTLHATGPNTTSATRRVYLSQYSARPVLGADGHLRRNAVPLLRNGERMTRG